MYCRQCGTQMSATDIKCPKCGTKAGKGSRVCPECGAKNTSGGKICDKCNFDFSVAVVTPVSKRETNIKPEVLKENQNTKQPAEPSVIIKKSGLNLNKSVTPGLSLKTETKPATAVKKPETSKKIVSENVEINPLLNKIVKSKDVKRQNNIFANEKISCNPFEEITDTQVPKDNFAEHISESINAMPQSKEVAVSKENKPDVVPQVKPIEKVNSQPQKEGKEYQNVADKKIEPNMQNEDTADDLSSIFPGAFEEESKKTTAPEIKESPATEFHTEQTVPAPVMSQKENDSFENENKHIFATSQFTIFGMLAVVLSVVAACSNSIFFLAAAIIAMIIAFVKKDKKHAIVALVVIVITIVQLVIMMIAPAIFYDILKEAIVTSMFTIQ